MPSAIEILKELTNFEFVYADAGLEHFKKTGKSLPIETIEKVKECNSCLFGATTTPIGEKFRNYKSPILSLRKQLNLFANLRPAKSLHENCIKNIDIVIIRENTEDLYSGIEREEKGKAIAEKVITKKACERIVKFGFDFALKNKRKKISAVHKANVLKKTDGMFREIFYEIAEDYGFENVGDDKCEDKFMKIGKNGKNSDNYKNKNIKISNKISVDDYYADAAAMHLILNPKRFDVIITLNLYGDILSDLTAGLIGGLGFAPSGNIGKKYSIFEPIHGSATDIANKGIANPSAMILSAKMLLEHLGFKEEAEIIDESLREVFKRKIFTKDVGGEYNTKEFTKEVLKEVRKMI